MTKMRCSIDWRRDNQYNVNRISPGPHIHYPVMIMRIRTVYIISLAVILLAAVIVMISAFSDITAHHTSAEVSAVLPRIIIDAGHGGEDGGAQVGDVLEKDLNLSIARKLADILRLSGYSVTEVRTSDKAVYSPEAGTLREKKVSDLNNRVELFNGDEHNIVVSIHQNKFDSSRYSGTQIFYSTNDDDSRELAERIRTAVVMLIQHDNTRELKPAGDDIFILDNAEVPAVIVECGFISNDEERAKLCDEEYQKQLAYAIAMGVLDYCNTY